MADARPRTHRRATRAFERRLRERCGAAIEAVLLYGSVARDEHRRDSDVDFIVVTGDDVDRHDVEDEVRDIAYDIELDHGVVLSLIVVSESEYERRKERPFYRHARADAERLYG